MSNQRGLDWRVTYRKGRREIREMNANPKQESIKGGNHLEELGIDGTVILNDSI
jgi:hypothetical protein